MRDTKALSALALLFVVASTAPAQEKPSVDDLIARLAAAKKDRADLLRKASELDKVASDLYREARELLESAGKRLDELYGPPGPMPGPGPGPINPPVVDPLRKKVADAFTADPAPLADKKKWASELSGYYEAAVEQKLADDPTLATAGELTARIRATVNLGPDKLATTRAVIGQELQAVLGSASAPLTAETRKALPLLFARVSLALDEVSK